MDTHAAGNLEHWDDRAPAHAASRTYGLERFDDPAFLSKIVAFDLPRLGDIAGLDAVHLQCHIGSDTVSLSRLGARMTGLDFSAVSLEQARELAARAGAAVEFVQSDLYDAAAALGGRTFDLVFTGVGALCWLPDIRRWAQVVASLLRPGGRLFLREGHPVLWTLAQREDDLLVIEDPYRETVEPTPWTSADTYTDSATPLAMTTTYTWNHGLGEIVTAVLDAGLVLTALEEHDSVPWDGLPGQMTLLPNEEWQLTDRPERLPHSYTLQAVRPR